MSNTLKCKICDREFKGFSGLGSHIVLKHKIKTEDYYNKYLKKNKSEGKCKTCGKNTTFININKGFRQYCSIKCSENNKTKQNNTKKTCLDKYGGVGFASTLLNKKQKQTMINNYNVEHALQNKYIKEKTKITCIKKYGYDNPSKNKKVKLKLVETNLLKYNTKYNFTSKDYYNKSRKTQKNNYWGRFNILLKEKFIQPSFDKEYFINNDVFNFKCLKCNKEFTSNTSDTKYIHCGCGGSSNIELQLLEWVKSLNKKVEGGKWFKYDKKRYELDIFLSEYNLGIELDGLYWHSTKRKEKNYHLNKTNWFKNNFNIDVIHILDIEWLDEYNRKEIENIIKNKLNLDKLEENRYINGSLYDRRYFPEIKGEILESKVLEFDKLKYQDCGYIKSI